MPTTTAAEFEQTLLKARADVPQLRAAMQPVELLERQVGDYIDESTSLLAAFTVAANIIDKHPGASTPFMKDAAAGFAPTDRDWAATLLLGAEVRRGLLTYRIAGLKPRDGEAALAQALQRCLDAATREGLDALQDRLKSSGRRVVESDLYLSVWGEGLSLAGNDPALAATAVQADNKRFIHLIMGWGRTRAESSR